MSWIRAAAGCIIKASGDRNHEEATCFRLILDQSCGTSGIPVPARPRFSCSLPNANQTTCCWSLSSSQWDTAPWHRPPPAAVIFSFCSSSNRGADSRPVSRLVTFSITACHQQRDGRSPNESSAFALISCSSLANFDQIKGTNVFFSADDEDRHEYMFKLQQSC